MNSALRFAARDAALASPPTIATFTRATCAHARRIATHHYASCA
jgi:hypothetical protein